MQTITLKINGKEIMARPEQTILDVVQEQKLDEIPTLCYSPELEPYGSCFLCVVEVKGRRTLVPSCATLVAPGMEVETHNERVVKSRKIALELLLSNHYADCVSPCNLGCPAHVDAQGYIALVAMGLYKEAVTLIRKTNPFPSVCGRVCVRKCEAVCRRKEIEEAVGINHLKRYITDMPGIYDDIPPSCVSTGKKVAIVGGGPSGLTAAYYLGLYGHEVVVYEALKHAGGMLRYGIPEYRLPKKVLDQEIDYILRASHATLKVEHRIGEHISLETLSKDFDAIYVAAGAFGSNKMGVQGEKETPGVVLGIDFLAEKTDDHTPIKGTVVVVGGGNTAMDAARVSWRLGAEKVIVLYRRTKAEMPADPLEIQACIDEGIEIIELAAPIGIVKQENGYLKALRCTRMVLGEPDSSGRRRPIPQEGSEFDLPCDMAITAIGQTPILKGLEKTDQEIGKTRWNTIVANRETMATNVKGIFAGGDVADDGPTVVIDAIADGGKAARAIHRYLGGTEESQEKIVVQKDLFAKPTKNELGEVPESPRHEIHEIEVKERANNFREVATGYEPEDATHECSRCLSCGCFAATDCLLRRYATDYKVDITQFAGYIRKQRVDERHPYILYDPNKCVLCARCVRTCSKVLGTSALGWINRGIKTEVRPAMNDPLAQTNCVGCGSCVQSCPTGALSIKLPFPGRCDLARQTLKTHCGFCSLACPITVHKYADSRYFIGASGTPGEYICRFGRFGFELFLRQERIRTPLSRRQGRMEEVDWAQAYRHIVEGIRSVADRHGPESVAVFASTELTNEEMYVASKIAREGIGTNNIGSLSVLTSGADLHALDESFGFTASTSDRSALEQADLVICNNTSLESEHLILSIAVIDAVQNHQAKLIVCSSAASSLSKMARMVLDPIRGRSALLWNSVIQSLLDEGFFDRAEIEKLPGGHEFLADKFDYTPEALEEKTGVEKEKIAAASEMVRNAKRIVFIHGHDRTIDRSPGDMVALANFMLLLETKGIHCDLLLPTSCPNFTGACVAGLDPGLRPLPKEVPGARSYEDLRKTIEDGKIKAALVIGEDPMRDTALCAFLSEIEFLAVVESGYTETVNLSDIVLPGATYLETPGSRCNFEGKMTSFQAALLPPSGKNGLEVLVELARAFSLQTVPSSPEQIRDQITHAMLANAQELMPYLWNMGQDRPWTGKGKLIVAKTESTPHKQASALTRISHYKHEAATIGMENFKVFFRTM